MKIIKTLITSALVAIICLPCLAQPTNPPDNLSNEAFRTWLKQNWYDTYENISSNTSSGYTAARLEMYNKIELVGDSMYCLYSGLGRAVPSNGFNSAGNALPFDCEHIVPQSIFNSNGPMKNDIHHLTPTYSNWNSTRGNFPFGENEDNDTEKWMRLDNQINCDNNTPCIPSTFIDEYSELISNGNNSSWEPREDAKGNVARSVFYFFTMYPNYNINSLGEIQTLYEWHLQDPPNADDIARNDMTEDFQGNRNPFVDYPEWVFDAWIDSTTVGVNDNLVTESVSFEFAANPVKANLLEVKISNPFANKYGYAVYSNSGKLIRKRHLKRYQNNDIIRIDVNALQNGMYWFVLFDKQGVQVSEAFLKM